MTDRFTITVEQLDIVLTSYAKTIPLVRAVRDAPNATPLHYADHLVLENWTRGQATDAHAALQAALAVLLDGIHHELPERLRASLPDADTLTRKQ